MTVHRPTADELLEALDEYLTQGLAPRLGGADAFLLRVAGNVLSTVRRELAEGAAIQARMAARYGALLGRSGDLAELTADLAGDIRSGRLAPDDLNLLEVLKEAAADRLAIDNPHYATFRRVRRDTEKTY